MLPVLAHFKQEGEGRILHELPQTYELFGENDTHSRDGPGFKLVRKVVGLY